MVGRDRARLFANYAALPIAILLLWQLAGDLGLVKRALLPGPLQVLATLWDLATGASGESGRYSGTLGRHLTASVTRVLAGFTIATVLGVALGTAIGLSRTVERAVDPTLQVLRNIPITAFLPLSILFFGISDQPAVFLIALGALFPTLVNTSFGVKEVGSRFVRAGRMLGVSGASLVTRIILPAAQPAIWTGLRLSLGVAWVLVVVSELIAVKSGLGYLLIDAYQFFRPDVMLACMVTIGLLGYLSDRLLLAVRARALAWNRLETIGG
ncbi:MAG: ABC transporter permease [Chloroflexi bacterium]|nr:ABC transporter permease [Chloroflexota bacterium]